MRVGMRPDTYRVALAVGLLIFILVVPTWILHGCPLSDPRPISLEVEAFEANSENLRGPGTAVFKSNSGPWSESLQEEFPANWIHYDYATIGVSKDGILVEPISAEWFHSDTRIAVLIQNDSENLIGVDGNRAGFVKLVQEKHWRGLLGGYPRTVGQVGRRQAPWSSTVYIEARGTTHAEDAGPNAATKVGATVGSDSTMAARSDEGQGAPPESYDPTRQIPPHTRAVIELRFEANYIKKGQLDLEIGNPDTSEVYAYRFIFAKK